jgi:ATPase inhibitor IATP
MAGAGGVEGAGGCVTERDAFADRGRALEEEYFRKREQELIEKLRRRAAAEAQLHRLGEQAGVADEEILQDLRDLGYTPETVMLLHLVPLVQMAWAEGGVSDRERALIVEAARARGVEAGSPADRQLAEWLTSRPSEQLFERTLRAIHAFLQARPAEEREASRRELLSLSTAIASASGGVLGFGAVSAEERALLARLSSELERAHGPVKDDDAAGGSERPPPPHPPGP